MRVFRQKGCKTWRVRFSVGCRQYDETLGTRLKEVAESKAKELVRERELEAAGILAPKVQRDAAQAPLKELLQNWLTVGLSPEVTTKHRTYCRNRSEKVFSECNWRYLRDVTATGFEAWRAAERKNGVAAKTLNEYLGHLRSFLGWLEQRGMILANPLRMVKPLRVVKEDDKRAFTLEELQLLVAVVPWYRACVYILAAFTGLRRAELGSLTWNRVILDGNPPRIELEAKRTKNRKGETLPLHADALAALQRLKKAGSTNYRARFVAFKGIVQMERFRKDLVLAGIALKDARGRELEFHSLRRTWATFLNGAGTAPSVAMQLLRHTDPRLTMGTYTDASLLPIAAALEKVPSLGSSLISSLHAGKTCPNVSKTGKGRKVQRETKAAESEGFRVDLALVVHDGPKALLADREGFEPSVSFTPHTLSRRARSTTLAPALARRRGR
jgi:integrase